MRLFIRAFIRNAEFELDQKSLAAVSLANYAKLKSQSKADKKLNNNSDAAKLKKEQAEKKLFEEQIKSQLEAMQSAQKLIFLDIIQTNITTAELKLLIIHKLNIYNNIQLVNIITQGKLLSNTQ